LRNQLLAGLRAEPASGDMLEESEQILKMRRFKLIIAYDGTNYSGWQVQPHCNSVQQEIQDCLSRITVSTVKLHGSGRTDSGVHARGQVAHVDLVTRLSKRTIYYALNSHLPADIRILKVVEVHSEFHARRSAKSKEYRYFVSAAPFVLPDKRLYCNNVYRSLDVHAMRIAATYFVGTHDFKSFAANSKREIPTFVRTISCFTICKRGSEIMFRVRGSGFLYKQVRGMVGLLLKVGTGDEKPEAVQELLEEHLPRTSRVPTAPARGLFLWQVWYGRGIKATTPTYSKKGS
jgi:tRNA pseudouridine38-40 synthase